MISLGSANIGIGLAIRLSDQFTSRATAVMGTMEAMQARVNTMVTTSLRGARNIGFFSAVIGTLLTAGFASAVSAAGDFNWTMTGVSAVTNRNKEDMEALSQTALTLSKDYTASAQQIAGGMEFLGRAGMSPQQIAKTIRGVTQLSTALDHAIEGVGGTADILTNIMTRYNIAVDKTGAVVDTLVAATVSANVNLTMLNESLKYVGLTATSLGITLEETSAMIAVMGNAGLQGGIAGRSLNNMLQQMAKAMSDLRSGRQSKVLQMIGLDPNTLIAANGEFKPMVEVMGILMQHLSKLPGRQQVALLQGLFNIRGARAIQPLLRNSVELGRTFNEQLQWMLQNQKGITQGIVDMRMDTWNGQTIRLRDTWKDFKIIMGETLEEVLMPMLKGIIKFVTVLAKFVKTPVGRAFTIMAATMGVVIMVGGILTAILATIKLTHMAVMATGVTMGRALTAAWISSEAAAARYAATAAGASFVSPTGAFTTKGVRGFQSGRKLARGAGMVGWNLASFFTWFPKAGKWMWTFLQRMIGTTAGLGKLGSILKGVATPVMGIAGAIVTILGMLVGFKNVVKVAEWILATFVNAVMTVVNVIRAIVTNIFSPWAMKAEVARALQGGRSRQDRVNETIWGKKPLDKGMTFTTPGTSKRLIMSDVPGDGPPMPSKAQLTVNVNLDGKQISKSMEEVEFEKFKQQLTGGGN